MGDGKLERRLRDAILGYSAALGELAAAMDDLYREVPIEPVDGLPPSWTARHVEVVLRVEAAWPRFVAAKRSYDGVKRELPDLYRW